MEQGRMVVETARSYGRVYQTGTQRLSEANHVFAIEMARTGRLGQIHTAYADCRWRDGHAPRLAAGRTAAVQGGTGLGRLDRPLPLAALQPRISTAAGGITSTISPPTWPCGAHSVAQVLPGLDMSGVSSIEFQYDSPDAVDGDPLVQRREDGPGPRRRRQLLDTARAASGSTAPRAGRPPPTDTPGPTSPRRPCYREYKKIVGEYVARTQRPMNHLRDFLNCVKSRRTTVANPEVMYNSMIICLAADICEQLKRNLTFDLRKAEFPGDSEANRLRSRAMREPWSV